MDLGLLKNVRKQERLGALLFWKAANGLKILPECYPQLLNTSSTPHIAVIEQDPLPTGTLGNTMVEFPSIFDGQIKTMDG